jgi:tetratricopeptide (TPR) repeat protein
LTLQIGEAYLRLRQPEPAERSFARAASIDPDNPHACLGIARVHLLRRENEAAAKAALQAIGLRYQLPMAHYVLGVALVRLGRTLSAVEALHAALAINPHYPEAHRLLSIIYSRRLGDREQAATHRQLARAMRAARRAARDDKRRFVPQEMTRVTTNDNQPLPGNTAGSAQPLPQSTAASASPASGSITVVSGLPRSGTSLVMQMLAAGGVPMLTDGRRQQDESNPRGYLEYEPVKNLRNDNSWLAAAQGRGVKIITHLLPYLASEFQYRIVYVERDLDEVLLSQRRMLERDGRQGARISDEQLRRTYSSQVTNIRRWLDAQPNVRLHTINFRELLAQPRESATAIAEFLGGGLDVDAMAAAVDPTLYRSRT